MANTHRTGANWQPPRVDTGDLLLQLGHEAERAGRWDPQGRHAEREPAVLVSLPYERWVERPRRNGRDPVWDSLWAKATAGAETDDEGVA